MRISILICLALTCVASAQSLRPALDVKAIINAHIQVDPATYLDSGTIIIRGGVITEVGNVAVPPGADILDAKGMTVYAGFIEGFTTKGIKAQADGPRQDVPFEAAQDVRTQMRSGVATIHADITGAQVYNPDDDVWKMYRNSGFTTALVSPEAGVVAGQSSLINLDGGPQRTSTLLPSFALTLRLVGQGNSYPGTVLGAYATLRQAFADANDLSLAQRAFESGAPYRPQNSAALRDLLGTLPFTVTANSYSEIENALDLTQSLHKKAVVIGAAEAWKAAKAMREEAVGTIVSLGFGIEPNPEKKSDEKKPEAKKPDDKKPDDKTANTQGPDQVTDDEEPVEKKQYRQVKWLEKVANASALAKAGIPFAFTTEGTKDPTEFFSNLRRAIKLGLPKEAALAGLTTNAAKVFGLGQVLGTVQAGHIANLTIFDKDFTADDAKAKYLFIDGNKYDPDKKPFKYSPPQNPFKE